MTDAPATTASDRSAPPARAPQRHVGVDAARGLAIVGMIAAHVIPRFSDAELIVDGRPSILFAVLAGLSLGLLTPTRAAATPGDARAARRGARAALATRALLLMVLGLWLWTLPTNIAIILDAYGLMFLLMVPLLFANRVVLAVVGAGVLALGPLLVSLTEPLPPFSVFSGASPIDRAAELVRDPVVVLADAFLTGYYPALLWLPLLCAGLIATRSDLTSTMTRLLMVTLGLAASLVGYGAAVFVPGVSAEAHAVTPAELLGSGGLAIAIIGGALLLLDSPGAFARASRIVLAPLIAIGRMPLTVYTLHVLLIALATEAFGIGPAGAYASPDGWWMLAALLVISAAVALIAMRRGARGPLELALARVTAAVAAPRRRRDAGAGPGTGTGADARTVAD